MESTPRKIPSQKQPPPQLSYEIDCWFFSCPKICRSKMKLLVNIVKIRRATPLLLPNLELLEYRLLWCLRRCFLLWRSLNWLEWRLGKSSEGRRRFLMFEFCRRECRVFLELLLLFGGLVLLCFRRGRILASVQKNENLIFWKFPKVTRVCQKWVI